MAVRVLNQNLGLLMAFCTCMVVSEDIERRCDQGKDCVLTCTAVIKPGVQYGAARWYKDTPDCLLRRELPLSEHGWHILLPNVSCGDGGAYLCRLAAPAAEQGLQGRLQLAVTDCADGPPKIQAIVFVVIASVMLFVALLLFMFHYGRLKNTLRKRSKALMKSVTLEAHLHPLDMNALQSIKTLGPKWSNSSKTNISTFTI